MKTPRELLLHQHETIHTRLDEVCRTAQAETLSGAKAAPSKPRSTTGSSFFGLLWQELFWAVRWTWAGFAIVWTLIVSVNMALLEKPVVLPADAFADWSSMLGALEKPERPRSLPQPLLPAHPQGVGSTATNV